MESGDALAMRDEIVAIYEQYEPTKVAQLPELFKMFNGKEQELLLMVKKIYLSAQSSHESSTAESAGANATLTQHNDIRLLLHKRRVGGRTRVVDKSLSSNNSGLLNSNGNSNSDGDNGSSNTKHAKYQPVGGGRVLQQGEFSPDVLRNIYCETLYCEIASFTSAHPDDRELDTFFMDLVPFKPTTEIGCCLCFILFYPPTECLRTLDSLKNKTGRYSLTKYIIQLFII